MLIICKTPLIKTRKYQLPDCQNPKISPGGHTSTFAPM